VIAMTRYLVLTKYDEDLKVPPMSEWDPDDITAHVEYLQALNRELIENGELVDGLALTGPDLARIVVSDGGPPVVTDGPFPESKELLAGYQVIDVDSEERALEIAAKVSAAPGPGGVPLRQRIELRSVLASLMPGADL
jgi:hypothetical protein